MPIMSPGISHAPFDYTEALAMGNPEINVDSSALAAELSMRPQPTPSTVPVSSYLSGSTGTTWRTPTTDQLKMADNAAREIQQIGDKGRGFVQRATQAGIPAPLAYAIGYNESRFNPDALRNKSVRDSKGNVIPDVSYGVVQMTDKALQDLKKKGYNVKYTTVEDLYGHPADAEQYGIWFIKENMKRAKKLGIPENDYARIASLHYAPYGKEDGLARTTYMERIQPVLMNLPDYAKGSI